MNEETGQTPELSKPTIETPQPGDLLHYNGVYKKVPLMVKGGDGEYVVDYFYKGSGPDRRRLAIQLSGAEVEARRKSNEAHEKARTDGIHLNLRTDATIKVLGVVHNDETDTRTLLFTCAKKGNLTIFPGGQEGCDDPHALKDIVAVDDTPIDKYLEKQVFLYPILQKISPQQITLKREI